MRKTIPHGVCWCCGKVGPVAHTSYSVPLDLGGESPREVDMELPDLCDGCNYAQQRWEAWQHHVAHPGAGYPYMEGPPASPPVRRSVTTERGQP